MSGRCFKGVSRKFKDVSKDFKGVSKSFQGCFKGVSVLRVYGDVSRKFYVAWYLANLISLTAYVLCLAILN